MQYRPSFKRRWGKVGEIGMDRRQFCDCRFEGGFSDHGDNFLALLAPSYFCANNCG